MGLFDRLRERMAAPPGRPAPGYGTPSSPDTTPASRGSRQRDPDEVAVERYRYLLRTAPPETIEQAHAEAFARLTPRQRQQVLEELGAAVPAAERARSAEPGDLARAATRAELHEPGFLERTFGGRGTGGSYVRGGTGGLGMGGIIGGSLLASVAGAFIGTAIADELFDGDALGGGGFLDDDGPFAGDGTVDGGGAPGGPSADTLVDDGSSIDGSSIDDGDIDDGDMGDGFDGAFDSGDF